MHQYSQAVHEINLNHRGYAFPYNDVKATNAPDLSDKMEAEDLDVFTIPISDAQ